MGQGRPADSLRARAGDACERASRAPVSALQLLLLRVALPASRGERRATDPERRARGTCARHCSVFCTAQHMNGKYLARRVRTDIPGSRLSARLSAWPPRPNHPPHAHAPDRLRPNAGAGRWFYPSLRNTFVRCQCRYARCPSSSRARICTSRPSTCRSSGVMAFDTMTAPSSARVMRPQSKTASR